MRSYANILCENNLIYGVNQISIVLLPYRYFPLISIPIMVIIKMVKFEYEIQDNLMIAKKKS